MVQNEPELHGFRKVVVVGSRRFSMIILRKNTLVTEKSNIILRVRGLLGCCSRGVPGG